MKKLSIFVLMLLIIGQTILGPIATVSANEFVSPSQENEEAEVTVSDPVTETGGNTETKEIEVIETPEASEEPIKQEPEFEESTEEKVDKPQETPEVNEGEKLEEPGDEESGQLEQTDEAVTVTKDDEENINMITPLQINYDSDMPDSVIKNVTFTVNGNSVSPDDSVVVKNGDKAHFRFDVSLAAGHDGGNYGEGTKLKYELPAIFEGLDLPKGNKFGDLGTISVDDRTVIITFNDAINGYAPIENSWFEVEALFTLDNTDWNKTIYLPGSVTVDLNFQPKGGNTITKSGTPDNNGVNSKFIDWKVTVNTNLGSTGVQDFVDELDGEHKFVTDSIVVKEIPIFPNGPGTPGGPITLIQAPSFDNNNKKMTISLPHKEHTGYEITYKTEVGDPGNVASADFSNAATYNGTTVSDNKRVTFGHPLAKSSSGPDTNLVTEWTINYNFNNRNIPQANAKLEDTWTVNGGSGATPKQDLVVNSFFVYDANGNTVDSSKYEMTPKVAGNGFDLSFNQDVTEPYIIKYKTKPNGVYPTSNFTVSNIVKRVDMDETKGANSTYSKTGLLLNKSTNGIDYNNKTMSWKIVANQAGYDLNAGTVFDDTFTDKNLTLQESTLVVKVGNSILVKDTHYELTNKGKDGFTIKLLSGTNERIEITYTTDYDIKDSGKDDRDRTYRNSVTVKESGLPADPTDSAEQTIKVEQKQNGKKDGYYNYATKTFHWDVELNFNYNTLTNAVFEDELPDTQKIESITVVEGTLDAGGHFVPGTTKAIANTSDAEHKIKLVLGDITGPYKVTYTSKDTDGVYPHGNGTVKITNKAKLSSDVGENASWTKTVEVKHTEKIFNKSGKQAATGSALINWNFEFNYAQSKLDNVVIEDTVGKDLDGDPDQLILKESFKVYTVALTGQTPSNPNTSAKTLVAPSNYTLDVDVENGTFTLDLGNVDKAYYVTYDTIFTGQSGSAVQNDVTVSYSSSAGDSGAGQHIFSEFTYGNNATTMKVPFVISKTDAATGEVMKDVEFTLYGPYTGDTKLMTGKTDENGVLDFGVKFAEGEYTLKETKVLGYDNPDVKFKLHRNNRMTSGTYDGKQIVEVENFEENYAPACANFTLTVKDVDGGLVASKEVTLTNKVTKKVHKLTTNNDGTITIPSNRDDRIAVGNYTVTTEEGGTDVTLGDLEIQYDDDCEALVQPRPTCDAFTIIVKDVAGGFRDGVSVTMKGQGVEIDATTGTDGSFTVPTTTKSGIYDLYEGKQFLGEVFVSYKTDCKADVQQAPTCPTFILRVKDVDGNISKGQTVIIKAKDGTPIKTAKTDTDGKIELTKLKADKYSVYDEDDKELDTFVTNIDCEAEVQPAPTCDFFTVTVNDGDGGARSGITITVNVEDVDGNQVKITKVTNAEGKITLPNNTKPGTYKVYEGELFIDTITVTYKGNCEAQVQGAPYCEDFTLTVQDRSGNPRAEVEITVRDASGSTVIENVKTDENGVVKIPNKIERGTYHVYEGTRLVNSFTVEDECEAIVKQRSSGGGGGTPPTPQTCDAFTVTVKQEGKVLGADVELTLKSGTTEVTGKTDANGKIVFKKGDLSAGKYTVADKDGKEIGTVTVSYEQGKCQAEVDLTLSLKVCEVFTVTVKQDGDLLGADVALTLKSGTTAVAGKTDANGKIVFKKDDLPTGTYTAIDKDGKVIGIVTVSYEQGKCQAEVDLTLNPKVCEEFTLTVTDTPNANVELKDVDGTTIVTGTTDSNGHVMFTQPIPDGKYQVYVQGERVDEITVTAYSCTATVTPGTPENPEKPETPEPGSPGSETPGTGITEPGSPGSETPGTGTTGPGSPGSKTPGLSAPGTVLAGSGEKAGNKLPLTGEAFPIGSIMGGLGAIALGAWLLFRRKSVVRK